MHDAIRKLIAAAALALAPLAAAAQQEIGSYIAEIGQADLFNSEGQRLSAPWQVLRQDRANFHRFGISQPGDQWDPWFANADNRATMERLVMNGFISPQASRDIMAGGATVFVTIYGSGGMATSVSVDVYR
jgi:hypothetical protein